jgi:hypothetical protein
MRRTNLGDLAIPFVALATICYLLLRRYYDSLPRLNYTVVVPIVALAVVEFVAARRVRAAVLHKADARPMTALAIARCVALAKASSLVAAGLIGAVGALLLRVVPDAGEVDAARHDTTVGVVWIVGAFILLGAALLLERASVDPGQSGKARDSGHSRDQH